jgi:hypothetical protein
MILSLAMQTYGYVPQKHILTEVHTRTLDLQVF